MFQKQKEKRRQEVMALLNGIIPVNANILSFEYIPRFFDDDFFAKIENNGKEYIFNTVKGAIYYNGKLYCNNSYHYLEKTDTLSKFLDVIKYTLN